MLRWLERQTRGDNHSSDCLHTGTTGVDLRGIVGEEGPPGGLGAPTTPAAATGAGGGPPTAAFAAMQVEGLKYLEDIHVLEHQHQHAQRQLMMQHLIQCGGSNEDFAAAVDQACAGLGAPPPSLTAARAAGAPPLPAAPPNMQETKGSAEETAGAAHAEAYLKEALTNPSKRIVQDTERQNLVRHPTPTPHTNKHHHPHQS